MWQQAAPLLCALLRGRGCHGLFIDCCVVVVAEDLENGAEGLWTVQVYVRVS